MKMKLMIAAQLATLAGTAFVLMATSAPREDCVPTSPTRYAVNSTCGPSAFVTVSNDRGCELTVDGAADANLPTQGHLLFDRHEEGFEIYEPIQHLADGGRIVTTFNAPNPDGGEPLSFRRCVVSTPPADGANERLLQCFPADSENVICEGSFVEDGVLTDAGTTDAGQGDGGATDAGEFDAGTTDAGDLDGGAADAGN